MKYTACEKTKIIYPGYVLLDLLLISAGANDIIDRSVDKTSKTTAICVWVLVWTAPF